MNKVLLENNNINTTTVIECLLTNSLHGALFILDKQGNILGISKGVEHNFGYTEEDVLGKYFDFLFTESDKAENTPVTEIAEVLSSGHSADFNYIVHKDGTHIWCEGESVYIEDDGNQSFIIKNVRALQEQKNLEHRLKEKNKQLLSINKDLDTFVYTASHDLKAPISNIEGLINSLEQELNDGCDKEEIASHIEMMYIALGQFKTTLNDLAIIGNEEGKEHELSVAFEEMFDQVTFDLKEQAKSSYAIIESDFSKAPTINFSRKNLRSIMHNLISNAIKFRSPERAPEIRVKTEHIGHFLLLIVSDNGLGIEEKDQAGVFSLFQRFHKHIEGTGVGMGIIKRIMDNAGGRIELESEPGKGSTFKLYFQYDQA